EIQRVDVRGRVFSPISKTVGTAVILMKSPMRLQNDIVLAGNPVPRSVGMRKHRDDADWVASLTRLLRQANLQRPEKRRGCQQASDHQPAGHVLLRAAFSQPFLC